MIITGFSFYIIVLENEINHLLRSTILLDLMMTDPFSKLHTLDLKNLQ